MTVPAITCACCGKALHALTCYSVSVPLEGPIQPVDLCGLACLADWAKSAQVTRDRRAQ